ncbi:RsmB/NOP family class I SAM-dependent RNA methyltransferase [Sphingomonas sinipercae]|uniref:RsmB/NOP family class I SAM-dependent RNA methyltransferase n=1 Tax=Sphingomonas sinipercae TaxID=2714944 RepID=A0A6G7ZMV1_9SPHN|nr:RsmB/NOP family class I SAM-dependent RNA methyltransferase [Sphingomonas sinipercae]QIL02252.1 RsmB/NOP family class I SAM-dependent RNA methyltransferase [Sphingomonas sinipercae]
MTPAARLQAAIEILDLVIGAARGEGAPADAIVTRYFKTRRYAGSKDRRAVRELVFQAIRRSGERPESGRSAMLGLALSEPEMLALFGEGRGPALAVEGELAAEARVVPRWIEAEFSPLVGPAEWPALLERAPLDIRVNIARTSREAMLAAFGGSVPTPLSPWGLRLPVESRVDDRAEFAEGLVEVQDEGSQLIALACSPQADARILDLCAGAGGKSLALAAAAPEADILATDSNRARLQNLVPRAARAGARIETRLLNPPNEVAELPDWRGSSDVVLVDAPCSGSGTWRRNPEGRWRLTPERLDRLAASQARLLGIAAELVRPGGTLVYAVCSLLAREGASQVERFLGERSDWNAQEVLDGIGRKDGAGKLLTPEQDGTDGFFIARLVKPC